MDFSKIFRKCCDFIEEHTNWHSLYRESLNHEIDTVEQIVTPALIKVRNNVLPNDLVEARVSDALTGVSGLTNLLPHYTLDDQLALKTIAYFKAVDTVLTTACAIEKTGAC